MINPLQRSALPPQAPVRHDRPRRRSPATLLALAAAAALLAAGCCSSQPRAVQPSFAGVPHALERSPDFPLPLTPAHRDQLLAFLASDGNRFQATEDPPDAPALNRARAEYGTVLDALAARAPLPADLRDGAAFRGLFDATLKPLTLHDARIGWDRGQLAAPRTADLTGVIKGQFVFGFYWRRLIPGRGEPDAASDSWTLGPKDANGAFAGLVVFHRSYAIPQPVR